MLVPPAASAWFAGVLTAVPWRARARKVASTATLVDLPFCAAPIWHDSFVIRGQYGHGGTGGGPPCPYGPLYWNVIGRDPTAMSSKGLLRCHCSVRGSPEGCQRAHLPGLPARSRPGRPGPP